MTVVFFCYQRWDRIWKTTNLIFQESTWMPYTNMEKLPYFILGDEIYRTFAFRHLKQYFFTPMKLNPTQLNHVVPCSFGSLWSWNEVKRKAIKSRRVYENVFIFAITNKSLYLFLSRRCSRMGTKLNPLVQGRPSCIKGLKDGTVARWLKASKIFRQLC